MIESQIHEDSRICKTQELIYLNKKGDISNEFVRRYSGSTLVEAQRITCKQLLTGLIPTKNHKQKDKKERKEEETRAREGQVVDREEFSSLVFGKLRSLVSASENEIVISFALFLFIEKRR